MEDKELESKQEVEETTTPPAPEVEPNTEPTELGEDESKQNDEGSEAEEIDYKAEWEKSEAGRAEAEAAKAKAEEKIVKMKKDKKEEALESGLKPEDLDALIAAKVEEVAQKQMDGFRQETREEMIARSIQAMTPDPFKQKLLKAKYDAQPKRGFTQEAIAEDLGDALLLVDKKKILEQNEELKNAIRVNGSISNTGAGTSVPREQKKTVKASAEDRRIADKFYGGDVEKYLKYKPKTY